MTDQELESALKEVNAKLEGFSRTEEKLSNREWKAKMRLQEEKELLEKIRKARENRNYSQEASASARYVMLKESATRHPFLNYLMNLKLRSHIWD